MTFLNDGGPVFMYPLLMLLILILLLITKSFIKKKENAKTISLIGSLGLFAIVLGFSAQIIGLMGGLTAIQESRISQQVLAAGIKISFYTSLFGMFIFLIARLGIIVLTWGQKDKTATS